MAAARRYKMAGLPPLPWLLGLYAPALSPPGAGLRIMPHWWRGFLSAYGGDCHGAIYPIITVVAQALRPSSSYGRALRRCYKIRRNSRYVSASLGGFLAAHQHAAADHLTSVMLSTVVLAALGYKMQSHADCAEAEFPHANKMPTTSLH